MTEARFTHLAELLRFRAKDTPQAKAFTFLEEGHFESNSATFHELDHRARLIAHAVKPFIDRPVLLCYSSSIEFVAAFFAVQYAGGIAVPICPPRVGRDTELLEGILNSCKPSLVLTSKRHESQLSKIDCLDRVCIINTEGLEEFNEPRLFLDCEGLGSDIAFIQYSSGSVGRPKGVMISHRNVLSNELLITKVFNSTNQSIGFNWLPHYHDMGLIGGILHPIFTGMHCYLMDPLYFLHKPFLWLKAISKYRVTVTGGPNFAYEHCLRRIKPEQIAGLDLSSWDVAFNGAEPVRMKTLNAFFERFKNVGFRRSSQLPCYGLAESTLMVTGKRMSAESSQIDIEIVSCGNLDGDISSELLIVHPETLVPCVLGEVGEIWLAGPAVSKGYWDNPALNEQVFGAFTADGQGPFLRTGDLGCVNMQGDLQVVGRHKELMIFRGKNYYPYDIEHSIQTELQLTRLLRTAAFSVERDGAEKLIVVQEVDRSLPLSTIPALIRERVSDEHGLHIDDLILVSAGDVPITTSGKIKRLAAKELYQKQALTPFEQPRIPSLILSEQLVSEV